MSLVVDESRVTRTTIPSNQFAQANDRIYRSVEHIFNKRFSCEKRTSYKIIVVHMFPVLSASQAFAVTEGYTWSQFKQCIIRNFITRNCIDCAEDIAFSNKAVWNHGDAVMEEHDTPFEYFEDNTTVFVIMIKRGDEWTPLCYGKSSL